ncbi:hypothetical protein M569_11779 [Genlisea aurea]|uniref:F-box domain-containing protein n=1 Tax=Genlisea aurea TaxID=192259 RepID=S8DJG7_9LAMI|nr:hypothetical protein M569_11779 [Genlisea aurea]
MGKVSPNERQLKARRHKRLSRTRKPKYLKPGALAHIRDAKAASKSCTNLGKKRIVVLSSKGSTASDPEAHRDKTPTNISPIRSRFDLLDGPADDAFSMSNSPSVPSTPCFEDQPSESRLESLPIDLLVKIICHLHHDQLRAVFHVSEKIRKAVIIARQFYFNYTTPDRSRQEMLNTKTPLPTEHWPFMSVKSGKAVWIQSPHAPKAPRHGPRPPSRLKFTEMKQIAAVLFQESSSSSFSSSKCLVPSVLKKQACSSSKPLGSNRVLFYEEELCQAVAQNKLM